MRLPSDFQCVSVWKLARFTCCRRAAMDGNRKEGCVMAFQTDKQKTAPTPEAAGPTDPYQAVARDRRVDRTEDLNEGEIAAVEANQMAPGFEYLDAELEPAGAPVVEVGVDFARKLHERGHVA